ncbi:unnamed protein product [Phytophthora lilii]|uniref:RxLR effector protein n=1 Tax=Phytophthora lilii TaxID=2077276 RepID=A0A9W6X0U8_9STRA|nr:unnamed protein product [Phytophthora lilii]
MLSPPEALLGQDARITAARSLTVGQAYRSRFLRTADQTIDEDEDEEREAKPYALEKLAYKISGIKKLTNFLNTKTLEIWLKQGKSQKEVFNLLELEGLKGRAFIHPRHKYWRQYVQMANAAEAAKTAKAAKAAEVAKAANGP